MATLHFTATTTSTPEEFVAGLTDFGPGRKELFHLGPSGFEPGPDPERASYQTFASFADPDGNGWLLQEVTECAER
jgi:hypothetical protein